MEILEDDYFLNNALIRYKRCKNLFLLCISKNKKRSNIAKKNMRILILVNYLVLKIN